jgi:hypothetical protein
MHNSQNGVDVAAGGPYDTLLIYDCLGCHGQGTADNIEFSDTTPQVLHTDTPDLAGGNFAYITGAKALVTGDTSSVGHNVVDLGVNEATIPDAAANYPPGDEFDNYGTYGLTRTTFTCAGQKGCHGDRTVDGSMAAISGAHHASDAPLKYGACEEGSQGSTVALSYRFLLAVYGCEDSDWQDTVGLTDHNEYKGATSGVEATISTPGSNTISGLCAECHGNFHGPATDPSDITASASGSPWLRHPTDIILPADVTKEYQYYNGSAGGGAPGNYSLDAPVARAEALTNVNYPTAQGTVTPGTNDAIVMCLSCHSVHASPYEDILRWDYSTIDAGAGADTTRCFICHTTKDTGA